MLSYFITKAPLVTCTWLSVLVISHGIMEWSMCSYMYCAIFHSVMQCAWMVKMLFLLFTPNCPHHFRTLTCSLCICSTLLLKHCRLCARVLFAWIFWLIPIKHLCNCELHWNEYPLSSCSLPSPLLFVFISILELTYLISVIDPWARPSLCFTFQQPFV